MPISGGEFPSTGSCPRRAPTAVLGVPHPHGVARSRLSVAGYADQHPIAPNTTADGRALNRRVDVVVLRNATPSQGATSR